MPGLEVADIFHRHGETYRQAHAGHLGRTERRVMGAIEACRTAALGGHVERCTDCGLIRIAYNSSHGHVRIKGFPPTHRLDRQNYFGIQGLSPISMT